MGYRCAVVGAGRQGVASAYDLAHLGGASEVRLLDVDGDAARRGAARINGLLGRPVASGMAVDASRTGDLAEALRGVHALVSAAPYSLNLGITEAALRARASMTDLGGHTDTVRRQLALDARARQAGVALVPDCGMGPGLNISLALYAMSLVEEPREVRIWDGGLPQQPEPPWNFTLTFSIRGLTNEYSGHAHFLRDGKVTHVPALSEVETLTFPPPLGELEAFVTSGGLSTAPWTFEGQLQVLENKTLRYPGHACQFQGFADLGLLDPKPVRAGGREVAPLEVFETLLARRITKPECRDICVMRVECRGTSGGRPARATVDLVDRYDERTGFTAMERLTGWHASIVAIHAARGLIPPGATPIERAMSGPAVVEEVRRRGIQVEERVEAG